MEKIKDGGGYVAASALGMGEGAMERIKDLRLTDLDPFAVDELHASEALPYRMHRWFSHSLTLSHTHSLSRARALSLYLSLSRSLSLYLSLSLFLSLLPPPYICMHVCVCVHTHTQVQGPACIRARDTGLRMRHAIWSFLPADGSRSDRAYVYLGQFCRLL